MVEHEKTYQKLRKELSDEEIAEAYVFPEDLDEKEKAEAEDDFRELRWKALKERTEEQRLFGELMQMRLLMRDYFERDSFEDEFSFSNQLGQYIRVLGRSQKEFATEIGLHPTKLSRLLNNREHPNVELTYRLDVHSGHVIPALYWWRLHARSIEEDVRTNELKKKQESKKVSNYLTFKGLTRRSRSSR